MSTTYAAPVAAPAAGPGVEGWVGRGIVWVVLLIGLILPAFTIDFAQACSLAAVYAVTGVSLNIIIGYTGQLSLGHQGFVGLGALTAANVVERQIGKASTSTPVSSFALGLLAAVLVTAVAALLLGLVALRIRGLYLALITLVFGLAVASSLFQLGSLNNNGSGVPANRPTLIESNAKYYLFSLLMVALVLYFDYCLMRSKTGRALLALKEDERVASAFGIAVVRYKLIAFGLAGGMVGLAGAMFTFRSQAFAAQNFGGNAGLNLALLFVVMVVVGGLGDRVGVVIAAALFGLLDYLLDKLFLAGPVMRALQDVPLLNAYYGPNKAAVAGLIGAVLLLQTLIFNPGGVGQVLGPLRRWLVGQRFSLHAESESGPRPVEGSASRA